MSWFVVWDRPEYREWALQVDYGYELAVIRKEPDRFMCVKAKLLFQERGMPEFEVVETEYVTSEEEAVKLTSLWRDG